MNLQLCEIANALIEIGSVPISLLFVRATAESETRNHYHETQDGIFADPGCLYGASHRLVGSRCLGQAFSVRPELADGHLEVVADRGHNLTGDIRCATFNLSNVEGAVSQ